MTDVLDQPDLAAPTTDDVAYLVEDPLGAPGDRQATLGNIAQAMAGWTPFTGTYAPKASPTGTGIATWPRFAASGVTGAVAPTRYVGGTVAGAPTTGTHAVGDFVIDQSGQVWICTVAGTPGTWEAPGSGRELAYADITSNATVTGVGAAARADVAGLSVTFTPQDRPLVIDMWLRYFLWGDGVGGSTTIAAGSNGVATSTFAGAGTLNVADTTGFQTSGELDVATGTTSARIRYTGKTGTSFTGCYTLYGGGTMATGGAVVPVASPVTGASLGGLGLAITDNAGTIVADSLGMAQYAQSVANQIKGPSKRFAAGALAAGVAVTYKIQAYCVSFGPQRVAAGAASPAYLTVREV